jgi:hypothetical protein
MGRGRRIGAALGAIAAALCLAAVPANAAAPQLYVAAGDGYSVAFKVEGSAVYVLGLDANVYCEVLEPREATAPSLHGFFAAPKLMKAEGTGLAASEGSGDEFGSREVKVTASVVGGKLLGSFEYTLSEQSGHCQTAGYFGTRPEVAFEAVPYAPVDGSAPPPPPAAGDAAVYYGVEGPLETFFTVYPSQFGLRGTVVSGCRGTIKKRGPSRHPLASGLSLVTLGADGSFHRKIRSYGPGGNSLIREAVTLAGSVTAEALVGTYSDRIGTQLGGHRKRVCHTGPLPFAVARYVPATG